jgi:hypothetical protein
MEESKMILNDYNKPQNYSPAFKASLKVNTLVKDAKRLENIEQLFAQKTSRYADEYLHLDFLNEEQSSLSATIGSSLCRRPKESAPHLIPRTLDDMMEELSDKEIVAKLVKYFKGLKVESKADRKLDPLKDRVSHLEALAKWNTRKAAAFENQGDKKFATIYRNIAEGNLKQAEQVKKQIPEIEEKTLNTLGKIAKGDPDLTENLDMLTWAAQG